MFFSPSKNFSRANSTPQNAENFNLRIVLGGGGSEGNFTRGALELLIPEILERGGKITGIDGTSAGAITAALFVSGFNTGGAKEGLKRVNAFWDDISKLGYSHFLARLNPFFPFHSANDKSRLWTQNLLLLNSFAKAAGYEPPVHQTLLKLLKKHIPDIKKLQNGVMDITLNTMTINPKTGEPQHHIHYAREITYDTIIASTALAHLGAKFLNGVRHFDGGHLKNGYLDAALSDERVTDIFVISTYPLDHAHQSPPTRNKLAVKQGQLHEDSFKAIIDDSHNIHFHSIAPQQAVSEIDRMRNDPVWMSERRKAGQKAARIWISENAPQFGHATTYPLPQGLVQRVLGLAA